MKLCEDNVICCDDNCKRCANLIYKKYLDMQEELRFTRQFIHNHGLKYALAHEWNRRNYDGK